MQKNQAEDEEIYLPSHLLDDNDDQPTTSSVKNSHAGQKEFAYSAPPIIFNLSFRLQEDFFGMSPKTWEMTQFSSGSKLEQKQKTCEITEFQLQQNSTRKLSLQNEQQYLSYMGYSNNNTPIISYFPTYSTVLEEILNNLAFVPSWCRDQYGSRNIQTALETGDEMVKGRIFDQIYNHLIQLIYDKFGNYVIQKYIDVGSEQQKQYIYETIKKEFLFICLHSYGCRVIQKIIQFATSQLHLQFEIMNMLDSHLLQIIMNQNGNHIVQKILEIFNRDPTQNLSKLLRKNLQKLSFHSFGCRVIQKYLECGKNDQIRLQILESLVGLSLQLCKCQYGNYIMQYIVSNTKQFETKVLKIFEDNFCSLSCNKFASNVIEKTIKTSKKSFVETIISRLITNQEFITIAKHQYGNYVIQSLLDSSSSQKRQLLKARLKENSQQISKSQFGRHVLMQMEKIK